MASRKIGQILRTKTVHRSQYKKLILTIDHLKQMSANLLTYVSEVKHSQGQLSADKLQKHLNLLEKAQIRCWRILKDTQFPQRDKCKADMDRIVQILQLQISKLRSIELEQRKLALERALNSQKPH